MRACNTPPRRATSRRTGRAEPAATSADGATAPTRCQLVVGVVGRVLPRPLARQFGEAALDLTPHPAHGDAEDALAALYEVDHLVRGGALVDARPVAHQRDLGEVLDAALAQVADRHPDLLQRDAGV